jgi:ribonuclease E
MLGGLVIAARMCESRRPWKDGCMSENVSESQIKSQMLINYVPGEECRVAVVEDGKLEEYHVEKFASASRVGNIYVGKVMNVEPAIQAAFVDFGVGDNGFLHMSDLHPRYFPGEEADTTERVGFKTPRRERPPIQACLRRGDEVIVQVLKEGVGTKGPTVTSYLSIPGRFLVMMPYMDRTGVSRKVEDEDQRRRMREILDQLELPDGFGFIVRTAGLDCSKVELKRDLAYLQRLWKDMERRLKTGDKPRLLYSESDLLVRSLRDGLGSEVGEVIIDHDIALNRAARFMKIVSPRGQARLLQHKSNTPIFHAFGIEQQVAMIHAREVPLPSGGRLVIDQTEAIVAIDVNSGKSRDSRNSEENAFQTNLEAVDEICRQLRLRDMGGIVINDLIDMRHGSHRKEIETRFAERLKRDKARSTVLPISDFGILELTRQRMRPSHESVHFLDCPMCRGRGMVQKPDSIASDALRDLAMVLDVEKIKRVEMGVSPRVAGEFLSTKRHVLSRLERISGKAIEMRVSEAVAVDRVMFYAYDESGADVDLTNLPRPKKPQGLVEFDLGNASDEIADSEESAPAHEHEHEHTEPVEDALDLHPIEQDGPVEVSDSWGAPPTDDRGRRGRRRGRGRGGDRPAPQGNQHGQQQGNQQAAPRQQDSRGGQGQRDQRQGQGGRAGQGGRGGHGNQGGRGGHDPRRGNPPVRVEPKPTHRPNTPPIGVPTDTAGFAGDHGDDSAPLAPLDLNAPGDVTQNGFAGDHDVAAHVGGDEHAPLMDGDETSGAPFEGEQGGDFNGPLGQPGQPGEGGGRRRRRRRRGRGRGRGGQDGMMPGQAPGAMGETAPMNGNAPHGHAQPSSDGFTENGGNGSPIPPANQGNAGNFAGEHDEGPDGPGEDDGPDEMSGAPMDHGGDSFQPGQQGQMGQQGEGGGRRRRRRRRGRGGRGGGEQGFAPGSPQGQQQNSGSPQGAPQSQHQGQHQGSRHGGGNSGGYQGGNQGGNRGSGYRNDRGPRDGQPRDARGGDRSAPPAQPAPRNDVPPATPSGGGDGGSNSGSSKSSDGAPKPRLLYAAGRRKLNPSELNRRPKPE